MSDDVVEHLPLVSVIIPSYNHDRYIKDCVESVLNQSYQSIEVFVVDDGSTDGSLDVLRGFGDRINLIQQRGGRQGRARNLALKQASGEYVAFLDSDDVYLPGRIDCAVEILRKRPEIDLVWSDFCEIDDEGQVLGEIRWISPEKDFRQQLIEGNVICNATVTVRRAMIDAIGFFDEARPRACDGIAWYQIAAKGGRFHHVNEVLVAYRKHGANDSNSFIPMTRERDEGLMVGILAYRNAGILSTRKEWLAVRNALLRQMAFRAASQAQLYASSSYLSKLLSMLISLMHRHAFLSILSFMRTMRRHLLSN